MPPRVSVLLPVYNGAAWLAGCVNSVLSQNMPDFELLIGDDASGDGSLDVLRSFTDSRIRVFAFRENAGLFPNLNRLLREASAPLVRFLCQDDQLEPHCLASEQACFGADSGIAMSICSVTVIDERGAVTGAWEVTHKARLLRPEQSLQEFFYYGCIAGNLSTVCARRSAIDAAGWFDESYRMAGDYEMWVRLCRQGGLADQQENLVRLRTHGERLSLIHGGGVEFMRENRRIRAVLTPLLPRNILGPVARYNGWRHDVFDAHHFVRCLLAGRFGQCAEIARIMGGRNLTAGLVRWLLSGNNRLYKPAAVIV